MRPIRSYLIWFTQRVGSTMLTQALEDTGVAGRPREWLNVASVRELLARHDAATVHDLRDALWREATTDNGIMGTKYGMTEALHSELTALLAGLVPELPDPDGRHAWNALYPDCMHVFMTRRNKIRLAVSWWRAIKSGEWHRPSRRTRTVFDPASGPIDRREPPSRADIADLYDYHAIAHLLAEASLREAAMQERFDRWGVVPYTVVYEDLIAAYEPTMRALLEFLQIPGRDAIELAAPAFERLADEVSEAWVQRFHRELDTRLAEQARAPAPPR
ncbi:MAG TPA: Stf0 family sulfotransferase [Kofleriaceae bacterium]